MYPYYGARGITVCDQWRNNADDYIDWALRNGKKKAGGTQVDRIDNDGPYSPENCRVTTSIVNANNKSNNVKLTAFGETKTIAEWSRDPRCAVSYPTLCSRARSRTMTHEEMVVTPTLHGGGRP